MQYAIIIFTVTAIVLWQINDIISAKINVPESKNFDSMELHFPVKNNLNQKTLGVDNDKGLAFYYSSPEIGDYDSLALKNNIEIVKMNYTLPIGEDTSYLENDKDSPNNLKDFVIPASDNEDETPINFEDLVHPNSKSKNEHPEDENASSNEDWLPSLTDLVNKDVSMYNASIIGNFPVLEPLKSHNSYAEFRNMYKSKANEKLNNVVKNATAIDLQDYFDNFKNNKAEKQRNTETEFTERIFNNGNKSSNFLNRLGDNVVNAQKKKNKKFRPVKHLIPDNNVVRKEKQGNEFDKQIENPVTDVDEYFRPKDFSKLTFPGVPMDTLVNILQPKIIEDPVHPSNYKDDLVPDLESPNFPTSSSIQFDVLDVLDMLETESRTRTSD